MPCEVVVFAPIVYSTRPRIDPFHVLLFGGESADDHPRTAGTQDISAPLEIVKNVACMPDVFCVYPFLIARDRLARRIERTALVRTRPVRIVRAFHFEMDAPYAEHIEDMEDYDSWTVAQRFVERFSVPVPSHDYREIVPSSAAELATSFSDSRVMRVKLSFRTTIVVSPRMIERYGLLWGPDFVCRADLFDTLQQHMDTEYFHIKRLLVK